MTKEPSVETKKCSMCESVLPLSDFYNKPSIKSGKMAHCKKCDAIKRKKFYPRDCSEHWKENYYRYRDIILANARKRREKRNNHAS